MIIAKMYLFVFFNILIYSKPIRATKTYLSLVRIKSPLNRKLTFPFVESLSTVNWYSSLSCGGGPCISWRIAQFYTLGTQPFENISGHCSINQESLPNPCFPNYLFCIKEIRTAVWWLQFLDNCFRLLFEIDR